MSRIVLDSSAVLALMDEEPGSEHVREVLELASISTVNLAEVFSKLEERGSTGRAAVRRLAGLMHSVEPFTAEQAEIAGALRTLTRSLGLSLGDRACLALTIWLEAEAYTADRVWAELDLGCRIRVIR